MHYGDIKVLIFKGTQYIILYILLFLRLLKKKTAWEQLNLRICHLRCKEKDQLRLRHKYLFQSSYYNIRRIFKSQLYIIFKLYNCYTKRDNEMS